jgi:opacity protein-like surface antigen
MRKSLLVGSLAVLVMSAAAPLALAHHPAPAGGGGQALQVVGLTADGRLVAFTSDRTRSVSSIGKVDGLAGDQSLVGVDYRIQDRKLYGVGNEGGIYTLSTRTAKATKVSQLSVALAGKRFGVDFNPAANRLRVISDTGQNLRHNIDD